MNERNAVNQRGESLGGSARGGGDADSAERVDGGSGVAESSGSSAGRRRGPASWLGPRWVVPVRSLVVVLAMVAAALGVLWIESAGVQNASAQLAIETVGKVAVPPLDATAGAQPSGQASPDPPAMSSPGAPTPPASGALPSSATATQATVTQGVLVVHVAGAVKNPGVYMVGPGSRVFDAVNAAGGAMPAAELAALNLAAPLADGLQVFVPTKEEAAKMLPRPGAVLAPESSPGSAANSHPGASGLLNLNTASAAELDTLPGVGPVLAERIVSWRTDHGPFATVDALDAVSGIGTKMMAGLRDLVTVS